MQNIKLNFVAKNELQYCKKMHKIRKAKCDLLERIPEQISRGMNFLFRDHAVE